MGVIEHGDHIWFGKQTNTHENKAITKLVLEDMHTDGAAVPECLSFLFVGSILICKS